MGEHSGLNSACSAVSRFTWCLLSSQITWNLWRGMKVSGSHCKAFNMKKQQNPESSPDESSLQHWWKLSIWPLRWEGHKGWVGYLWPSDNWYETVDDILANVFTNLKALKTTFNEEPCKAGKMQLLQCFNYKEENSLVLLWSSPSLLIRDFIMMMNAPACIVHHNKSQQTSQTEKLSRGHKNRRHNATDQSAFWTSSFRQRVNNVGKGFPE